ncbi:MAG: hypothetical protein ACW98Y_03530 [Candidatus Thorarchaeota archaeon]
MTDSDTLDLQDKSEESSNSKLQSVLKPLIQHRFANPIFRISRVLLLAFGIWTFLLYYWSILGIVIGLGITILSNERTWRSHGIVLAYGAGALAPLLSGYSFLLTFFVLVFLVVYYLGAVVVFCITSVLGLVHRLRKQPKKEPRVSGFSFRSLSRVKFLLVLGILLGPFLLWSTVDIDLGVMFDNSTASLWVNVPSTVNVGEEFDITVEAWDSFERISASYRGLYLHRILV